MAVDIDTRQPGVLTAGVPRLLFPAVLASAVADRNAWDVIADGRRFLVNTPTNIQQGQVTLITVVVNWLAGVSTQRS
jgi:hypothetical protein